MLYYLWVYSEIIQLYKHIYIYTYIYGLFQILFHSGYNGALTRVLCAMQWLPVGYLFNIQ